MDAADFIRRNFHRRPTLAEVAEAAALSRFHFQRLFKRRFGESPYQMAARLQVERAKELLVRGVPGKQVARALGFSHQSHFVTRFKRSTGTTPGRWAARELEQKARHGRKAEGK